MPLMFKPWGEVRSERLTPLSFIQGIASLGVRLLGIAGYLLAVHVSLPQSAQARAPWLSLVYWFGGALLVLNVLDFVFSRNDVRNAVREGMTENNRYAAFVAVEKMKYKVSEFSFDGQGEISKALTGYAMSDDEAAKVIQQKNKELNERLNRHVWTELKSIVAESTELGFISIDKYLAEIARYGFTDDGAVHAAFSGLDDLSRQLLYPVQND